MTLADVVEQRKLLKGLGFHRCPRELLRTMSTATELFYSNEIITEHNYGRFVFDSYGEDTGYLAYKQQMSLEQDEETDDISEYLKPSHEFINPMEFVSDTFKHIIFGYVRTNFKSKTQFPCMISGILLDYYCDDSMQLKMKRYHNKSIPKQLKSQGFALSDITFLINKTQSNPDINLYDALVITQQKQIHENRRLIMSPSISWNHQSMNYSQLKITALIFGFNKTITYKSYDEEVLHLVNHLCVLYYVPWYFHDKESLSNIEVAQWIAFLAEGYQLYQNEFIENAIDGEFMNETDDEILRELLINNADHRKHILQSWARL